MHFSIDTASMTIPFLCVIVTYCVVLAGLGWYGSRQNKNLADFFTMSGKAGAILTGVAYFSTQYSMSTFMGVPGSIYHVGYAGMSTISSLLLTATSAASRDIYQKILNRNATDEETWKLSKVITVVLGIIAIGIGVMKPGSIFQIVLFAFGGLGIWAAPILLGMYWKRTTTAGVYVGVISAEILYVLITLKFTSWSFGFNPLIVAWLFAMIVIILVSLVTKPVSQETLDRHFADLERVKG